MSAPHDPWKDVGIELLTLEDSRVIERLLAVINAARAADAERHQAEIDANDKHIFVAEHIITQHGEFGGLFQPGGRFHRVANLMLGGSAVVDGGKWLVEQYDAQAQEIATLRATVDQQQARIAELESALKGVMPFVATQRMAC